MARSAARTGLRLLGAWLLVTGISQLVPLPIPYLGTILALLAVIGGLLLLVGA